MIEQKGYHSISHVYEEEKGLKEDESSKNIQHFQESKS